ncbi:DNA cytosine methyltransferase [Streptomyces violaceusniger]
MCVLTAGFPCQDLSVAGSRTGVPKARRTRSTTTAASPSPPPSPSDCANP